MEYEEDTRQAYLADEVDRRSLSANSRTPQYAGLAVAEPGATLSSLDEDNLDGAMAELADQRGLSLTEVSEQVLILAGGERDCVSRAIALLELAALDEDTALRLTVSTEKRMSLPTRARAGRSRMAASPCTTPSTSAWPRHFSSRGSWLVTAPPRSARTSTRLLPSRPARPG